LILFTKEQNCTKLPETDPQLCGNQGSLGPYLIILALLNGGLQFEDSIAAPFSQLMAVMCC
jgi:hypothetical protein